MVLLKFSEMLPSVFFGESENLFQGVIERKEQAFVYNALELSDRPILQDMELDGNGEFVYALTHASVTFIL